VKPLYSDLTEFAILAYSKEEIVAEKTRALLQQQAKWPRPRDLYDLWFIFCRQRESFDREKLKELFARKCQMRSIKPDPLLLVAGPLRD
jgi:predicted nucleotidyltransferase component of viral defense system